MSISDYDAWKLATPPYYDDDERDICETCGMRVSAGECGCEPEEIPEDE